MSITPGVIPFLLVLAALVEALISVHRNSSNSRPSNKAAPLPKLPF
jgi:hypothetical protein